ncbi:MAG: alkaline phosphatase D family protein [Hyphococcus sp.]
MKRLQIRSALCSTALAALGFMAASCVATPPRATVNAPFVSAAGNPEAPDGAIRATPMPSAPLDMSKTLTRIVFASCAQQNEDQSIWNRIAAENPDLTLYIGDNVYGDVRSRDASLPELKAAYMRLAQSAPFAKARSAAPMLTVWDDHDYGMNDAGGDYQYKESAQALFNYVWAVPDDDPRRARPGIYNAWTFGAQEGKRVQVIMLDTRYFRSPLQETDERGARGKERYLPDADPAKTMLGEAQWAWLAQELKKPADLRLLVSSVQVIADGHGWEAWKMLPAERNRLYQLIDETNADNLMILSGDRHAAALYRKDDALEYPLFEATSSSLNLPAARWREEGGETYMEPGPYRLGDMFYEANYGLLEIDWESGAVAVAIHDETGAPVRSELVALSALR